MTKSKLNATSFAMRMKMVCAVLVNNCLSFCILLGLDSKDKWNSLLKNLNWMLNKQYIIIFKYTFKLNMFTLMATTKNKTLKQKQLKRD